METGSAKEERDEGARLGTNERLFQASDVCMYIYSVTSSSFRLGIFTLRSRF